MNHSPQFSVSCLTGSPALQHRAEQLAARLRAPFVNHVHQSKTVLVLVYTQKGLMLQDIGKNVKKPQTLLFVDFPGGRNGYRFAREKTIRLPLARAAGVKPGFRPSILDATAGLGTDGFVLASLGCDVTLCERSAVVGALLQDGIDRALASGTTRDLFVNRIHFVAEDSVRYLRHTDRTFHCIYLDPMYPVTGSSALNSLAMRTLRDLVGDDSDCVALLEKSLAVAANRVVVKRPLHAQSIDGKEPSHRITMKNSRFDVYLTFNEAPGETSG
jgi:16S rRNA (guanine1516-N2)-methyltransferase